ncbi:hypothetical protein BBBOND_0107500 [Babesia bigemina]|uniref:Uncharacterized protein n=1 Tax=Babesia bigemina TaxID=5866 RepID=A0A061D2Y3_BABBI|nr:hypothetical protein BBBOND_0107500 [Babesia bigemina]CDR94452.1 hypothetical protein BBBOND_0107500 [Babesia bigemina]|eukprot:XP_012766638.1 hypothetical protein BBBOND_0107500 [Babesia bigemina]
MVYYSLTEVPRDLREGIDWLLAVKGTDGHGLKELIAAVYRFLYRQPVGLIRLTPIEDIKRIFKKFLEQRALKDKAFAGAMLKRLKTPMEKNPNATLKVLKGIKDSDHMTLKTRGVTYDSMANDFNTLVDSLEKFLDDIKNPDQYRSYYSSEATWSDSCSERPEDCAMIFVGIAPILYVGMQAMFDASSNGVVGLKMFRAKDHLERVLFALGYVEPEIRANMSSADLRSALGVMNKAVMNTIYDLAGFWAFY